MRYADAEANVVPEPTPPIGKFKFREAEAGRDLSARSRQLQLTFGTKYVAMEAAIHWRPLDVTFKYRIAV